jgi:hypothetical protein
MSAGEIALVGAVAGIVASVVGAGGAVMAARLTGRHQSRSQHAQWRRQVRRDAYVTFLESVAQFNELGRTYRAWTSLGRTMPEGTAEKLHEFVCRIEKALFAVELEGPSEVAAQANTVRRSITDWHVSVVVSELRAVQGVPPWDAVPNADALYRQVDESVVIFKSVARAALEHPDTVDRT